MPEVPTSAVVPLRDQSSAHGWIGVHFVCSNTYQRVSKRRDGQMFIARCGKCGKCARFRVGSGGTAQRFFQVSCTS